jgi:hypothetical protein
VSKIIKDIISTLKKKAGSMKFGRGRLNFSSKSSRKIENEASYRSNSI